MIAYIFRMPFSGRHTYITQTVSTDFPADFINGHPVCNQFFSAVNICFVVTGVPLSAKILKCRKKQKGAAE